MSMQHWSKTDAAQMPNSLHDAQDVTAALLLRRVEAMLRQGQPRQAIAHICETTGVDHPQAEAFVEVLKTQLFS
jgi:hypothetical protein